MAVLPYKEITAGVLLKNGTSIKMKPINLKQTFQEAHADGSKKLHEDEKNELIAVLVSMLEEIIQSFIEYKSEQTLSFIVKGGIETTIDTSEIAMTWVKRQHFRTNIFNRI